MRDWFRGNLTAGGPRYQLDLTPYHKKLLTTLYNAWLAKTYPATTLARIRSAAHVSSGEDVPLLQRHGVRHRANGPLLRRSGLSTCISKPAFWRRCVTISAKTSA